MLRRCTAWNREVCDIFFVWLACDYIQIKQIIYYFLIPLMAKTLNLCTIWLCGHHMLLGAQFHA